jgi:tektin-4
LEREINDMASETEDLLAMKRRMERAVFAGDLALLIITDNLNCRETREGIDKCQDDVELNLIKVS